MFPRCHFRAQLQWIFFTRPRFGEIQPYREGKRSFAISSKWLDKQADCLRNGNQSKYGEGVPAYDHAQDGSLNSVWSCGKGVHGESVSRFSIFGDVVD